jgi:hypothetical protein
MCTTKRSYVLLCTIKRIISSYVASKVHVSLKFTTSVSFSNVRLFSKPSDVQSTPEASSAAELAWLAMAVLARP